MDMSPHRSMLRHALKYASGGWLVFPLLPNKKQPMTPHGFLDATSNLDQVREWWEAEPRANIGLHVPPGVLVLDFDPRNGCPTLQELGLSQATMSVHTPSGGAHFYYRVPPDFQAHAHWPQVDGVDVKQHGTGYVLLPPSVVGRPYAWAGTGVMRNLPPHALEVLRRQERELLPTDVNSVAKYWPWENGTAYGLRALDDQVSKVTHAQMGRRNNTLFTATLVLSKLIAGGELSDAALALVREAALDVGLPDFEVYQTMLSAYERGMKEPMSAPERKAR